MPSPFPGFDPYIENLTDWSSFHSDFITDLKRAILPDLPPGFDARTEAHISLIKPEQRKSGQNRTAFRQPDVAVFRQLSAPTRENSGGIAVLERPQTEIHTNGDTRTVTEPEYFEALSLRQRYIEIVDTRSGDQVIAVIELLSPTNKDGRTGTIEYGRKQHQLLNSDVHLMEIDLLRGGADVTMVGRDALARFGGYDYLVTLRDADDDADFRFWRIGLRDPLPAMHLPLTPDVEPIVLDLGAAFTKCYDASYLGRRLDYTKEPEPPLSPDDATWANDVLKAAGLRV